MERGSENKANSNATELTILNEIHLFLSNKLILIMFARILIVFTKEKFLGSPYSVILEMFP